MRMSYAVLPLLALGLAACTPSGDADKAAAPASDAASAPAAPIATVSPEDGAKIAHERHEGFEGIGKSMKAIGDQLKAGTPDVAVIQGAAAKIAEAAPKVKDWFPAGSGKAVAPKSKTLDAVWEKPADFAAALDKFTAAAATFNTTAQAGDLAAIGAGMKDLGGTCKGCHEKFKAKDEDHD